MTLFLKLKHWQLFLFTWGIPIAVNIFTFSDPYLFLKLFPFVMIVFATGILGWVWAIATKLHPKLPGSVPMNITRFKVLLVIPTVYMLSVTLLVAFMTSGGFAPDEQLFIRFMAVIVVIHVLSMVCIFAGLLLAAKTMKSVELGRAVSFSDYAAEFVLLWFSPIGLWILQPRLNKLIQ